MDSFWLKLPKPFFILAPMYDVTDEAFRQMFARYGKPDVLFTEFVSVDGLTSEKGWAKVVRELYFQPNEHPIVAQVFGADPEKFRVAATVIADLGFDGIDINMGCPDRTIIKQGAGSALIRKPDLAKKIIEATKAGAKGLPVSVKTRLGYSKTDEMTDWLGAILSAKPDLLTVHVRTTKELSKVPAHWELVPKIVKMAKENDVPLVINGDVMTLAEAREKAEKYGLAGVMIGRGAFGNPWLFSGQTDISLKEKLAVLVEQIKLFEKLYGGTATNKKLFGGHTKNFAVMKKHFKAYIKGWPGAPALREKLMTAESSKEVGDIISLYLKN